MVFSRDMVMDDITRFRDAIIKMYEVDSCEVYEVEQGDSVDLGWRVTKGGKEYIIASTYDVTLEGLKQRQDEHRMKAISGDVLTKFRTLGDCMDHFGIRRVAS